MPTPAIVLITILMCVAGLTAALVVRLHIQRRRAIRDFVDRNHLVHERKGDKAFRKAWAVLPEIPDRGNISNLIYGTLSGVDLTMFEHTHMVMAGNTPVAIVHTVAAAEIDPLTPEVHIVRRSFLKSIAESFFSGKPSVPLDDEAFRKEWVVRADDADFARALLSPEVQDQLRGRKHDRGWHIFGGKLAAVQRRQMGRRVLEDLPARLIAVTRQLHSMTPVPIPEGENVP
ncbi:MAG: hypothetical protein KDA21_10185 [Phycisphaerales bacterium]|nr:hypothetical protein [Phycisphaerales bacterium]